MLASVQSNITASPTQLARLLSIAIAILLGAACGASESARSGAVSPETLGQSMESMTLVPGIVIEPTHGSVYLMSPGGGIESLTINDGDVRWKSAEADLPLFAAEEKLMAVIDSATVGLSVALIDAATGRPAANGENKMILPLPASVSAGIDQTLERSFTYDVQASGGKIYLTWDFLQREITGVAPPGGRSPERRERGAFRYLGDTFEAVSPESVVDDSTNWPAALEETLASQPIRRPPAQTGEVFALTEQLYDPELVLLRRWRASDGTRLQDKRLYEGRAVAVLNSCDERHVVIAAPGEHIGSAQPYVLRYYDLDSGALLFESPSTRSAGPFCIVGSRLLRLSQPAWRREEGAMIETPLEVVALDVNSGAEAWRRAVRDTAFRGPAPPGT